MSDSVRPHRRQPTRLPHPWDSPGKNTGVGCHFLLQCMKVESESESEVPQSCLTLSDPMDCSPSGSSVHGIFQARILEWGATAFSVNSPYCVSNPILSTTLMLMHCTLRQLTSGMSLPSYTWGNSGTEGLMNNLPNIIVSEWQSQDSNLCNPASELVL